MTAAISLPDTLFETAEHTAAQLGISRNALIETALEKYLNELTVTKALPQEEASSLKERFNAVYDKEESALDPLFAEVQARSLPQEDTW